MDFVIDAALQEDREKERAGVPDPDDPHYHFMIRAYAMEPTLALAAVVCFNRLEERVRRVFFALLETPSIDALTEKGFGTREEIGKCMREALFALKYLDDSVRFPPGGRS